MFLTLATLTDVREEMVFVPSNLIINHHHHHPTTRPGTMDTAQWWWHWMLDEMMMAVKTIPTFQFL